MKFQALVASFVGAHLYKESEATFFRFNTVLFNKQNNGQGNNASSTSVSSVVEGGLEKHGHNASSEEVSPEGMSGCRCIGFSNSPGSVLAQIKDDQVKYPGGTGGQCQAWDDGRHPDCQGSSPPGWCKKKWCFVDPCSCSQEASAKMSDYLGENVAFQGKEVYYSYATCGEEDLYSSGKKAKTSDDSDEESLQDTCEAPAAGDSFGDEDCPCIGFTGIDGETLVKIGDVSRKYPAELGSSCMAWDDDLHPECQVENKEDRPDWCEAEWCYVDPKKCNNVEVEKTTSTYQPAAKYQGQPLSFSYATCAQNVDFAKDSFLEEDEEEEDNMDGAEEDDAAGEDDEDQDADEDDEDDA